MILATEDSVSEAVVAKLISTTRPDLKVLSSIGNRGKGYLKDKARDLNRTARSMPVFMLIDLDSPNPCPADLLSTWLHSTPEANMLFRVAVMEVESWILADRRNFSDFLGVPTQRIPTDTDELDDPKQFLVNLARRSRRRDIRDELVPAPGSSVSVGPAYNVRICAFVSARWDPATACRSSGSLRRTVERLGEPFGIL